MEWYRRVLPSFLHLSAKPSRAYEVSFLKMAREDEVDAVDIKLRKQKGVLRRASERPCCRLSVHIHLLFDSTHE